MSFEKIDCPDGADILPEGSRGFDPLHRLDRDAIAAYSSNPGFRKGSSLTEASPLTQGVIIVYADDHPRADFPEDKRPIDVIGVDEAVLCLSDLRQRVAKGSRPELQQAGDMISSLRSRKQEVSEPVVCIRQPSTLLNAVRDPVEDNSAQQAEVAAKARQDAKDKYEQRQSAYRVQLRQAVDTYEAARPDVNARDFLKIGEGMSIYELRSGELAAREEGSDTEIMIRERVNAYLANPRLLFNDYMLGAVIRSYDLPEPQAKVVHAYKDRINVLIMKSLRTSRYPLSQFTPETIAKWLELGSGFPPETEIEEFNRRFREDDEEVWAYGGAMSLGQRILSNSLQTIAVEHPREFVDSLYLFADMGLDPDKPVQRNIVLRSLQHCLEEEPRAGLIVGLSTRLEPFEDRLKAADLDEILIRFNIPNTLLGHLGSDKRSRHPKSRKQLVRRLIRPSLIPNYNLKDKDYDELDAQIGRRLQDEFRDYADTPEGRARTIAGRFLTATEA